MNDCSKEDSPSLVILSRPSKGGENPDHGTIPARSTQGVLFNASGQRLLRNAPGEGKIVNERDMNAVLASGGSPNPSDGLGNPLIQSACPELNAGEDIFQRDDRIDGSELARPSSRCSDDWVEITQPSAQPAESVCPESMESAGMTTTTTACEYNASAFHATEEGSPMPTCRDRECEGSGETGWNLKNIVLDNDAHLCLLGPGGSVENCRLGERASVVLGTAGDQLFVGPDDENVGPFGLLRTSSTVCIVGSFSGVSVGTVRSQESKDDSGPFGNFVARLRQHPIGADRMAALGHLVAGVTCFSGDQLLLLLDLFSYDRGRLQALMILQSKVDRCTGDQLLQLLGLFSYDSGRLGALEVLQPKVNRCTGSLLLLLLDLFSYDRGRLQALMILYSKVDRCTGDQLLRLLDLFSYGRERSVARGILQSRETA